MTLVRYSNQLPPFFNRVLDSNLINRSGNITTTLPSVNIKETENGFDVEVAAPGFEKEDFNIEVNKDILTISSEKKVESETTEKDNYTRREYNYQSFKRSFTLPESADTEKIAANYKNGILAISIPKKEEEKPLPKRTVEIN